MLNNQWWRKKSNNNWFFLYFQNVYRKLRNWKIVKLMWVRDRERWENLNESHFVIWFWFKIPIPLLWSHESSSSSTLPNHNRALLVQYGGRILGYDLKIYSQSTDSTDWEFPSVDWLIHDSFCRAREKDERIPWTKSWLRIEQL